MLGGMLSVVLRKVSFFSASRLLMLFMVQLVRFSVCRRFTLCRKFMSCAL